MALPTDRRLGSPMLVSGPGCEIRMCGSPMGRSRMRRNVLSAEEGAITWLANPSDADA